MKSYMNRYGYEVEYLETPKPTACIRIRMISSSYLNHDSIFLVFANLFHPDQLSMNVSLS